MHSKSFAIVVFLSLALALAAPAAAASAPFEVAPFIQPHQVGTWSPVVAADDGTLHTVYGLQAVYYAFRDGEGWHVETVAAFLAEDYSCYPTIAVDGGGTVHVAYVEHATKLLRYAKRAEGAWNVETVVALSDDDPTAPTRLSIAADATGRPHIAYRTAGVIRVAVKSEAGWESETVGAGTCPSLALDTAAHAHVSYQDTSALRLMYATNAAGAWASQVVDGAPNTGLLSAIGVDSQNHVHIAYYWYTTTPTTTKALMYATDESGSFALTVVTTQAIPVAPNHITMAMDASDAIHVGYEGLYARKTSGGWTVEGSPALSDNHFLTADSAGIAHVVVGGSGGLYYSTNVTGAWQVEQVDISIKYNYGYYSYISLAKDQSGKQHIAFAGDYGGTHTDLIYLTNPSGRWETEVIDTESAVSVAVPVTWTVVDSSGGVHVSYGSCRSEIGHTAYDIRYASRINGIWGVEHLGSWTPTSPEVDAGAPFDFGMVLDKDDAVHIVYGATEALVHLTNASGAWVHEAVPGVANVKYVAVAADSSGALHVGYQYTAASGFGALGYATNASGTWTAETVDDNLDVGAYVGIAVDRGGRVHLAYFDARNHTLKYALGRAGSWMVEVADSHWNMGMYCRIVLDPQGRPCIAHFNPNRSKLYYTAKVGGMWTTEFVASYVDGTSVPFRFVQLFVERSGSPLVAFISNNWGYLARKSLATGFPKAPMLLPILGE